MRQVRRGRSHSVSSERETPLPGTSEDLHAWSIYRQAGLTSLMDTYLIAIYVSEPEQ